jgi:hypothetical protein
MKIIKFVSVILLFMFMLSGICSANIRNIQDNAQIIYNILDENGTPVGSQIPTAKIQKMSNGYWYDFDDSTFKTSGWGNKSMNMTEDTTEDYYYYTFNPPASENVTEQYQVLIENANTTYKDHQSIILNYQNIGTSTFSNATDAVIVATNNDKAGYGLAAGAVNVTTAPNLDAAITSRMATFTYTAPDNTNITNILSLINTVNNTTSAFNTTWTSTKAGYLDVAISSRGTSTLTASDNIGINWADISNPTTAVNLTGTNIAVNQTIASVSGAVNSVTAGVNITTNNDKTGYALSAAGVDAIWDETQTGHTNATTFGKYLDAQVSAISATIGASDINNITAGIWNATMTDYNGTGTMGNKMNIIPTSGTGDWTSEQKTTILNSLSNIGNYTDGDKENGNYSGIENMIRIHR